MSCAHCFAIFNDRLKKSSPATAQKQTNPPKKRFDISKNLCYSTATDADPGRAPRATEGDRQPGKHADPALQLNHLRLEVTAGLSEETVGRCEALVCVGSNNT